MPQPDEVSIEDAYAAALAEVGRLQQRVIMGQALIEKLKRQDHPAPKRWTEVSDGPQDSGYAGDECGDDPPYDFSD